MFDTKKYKSAIRDLFSKKTVETYVGFESITDATGDERFNRHSTIAKK
jgi:hypothetical protein